MIPRVCSISAEQLLVISSIPIAIIAIIIALYSYYSYHSYPYHNRGYIDLGNLTEYICDRIDVNRFNGGS